MKADIYKEIKSCHKRERSKDILQAKKQNQTLKDKILKSQRNMQPQPSAKYIEASPERNHGL